MDGMQLADMMRDNPDTKDIPIIFLSALLSKDIDKTNPHALGGEVFIAKPFKIRELISEVDRALVSHAHLAHS
jgi:CheY-like chemotaxis protein